MFRATIRRTSRRVDRVAAKKRKDRAFDILAAGHGELGTKRDVRAMRQYMQELRTQVLQYLRQGKSVEEIKTLVKMAKYRDWGSCKQYLALNHH